MLNMSEKVMIHPPPSYVDDGEPEYRPAMIHLRPSERQRAEVEARLRKFEAKRKARLERDLPPEEPRIWTEEEERASKCL